MSSISIRRAGGLLAVAAALLLGSSGVVTAAIQGVTATDAVINLTAKDGYIQTPDANSIYMWGFAYNNGRMQYPGPTLDLPVGVAVTVNLANRLTVPVSIVFPGQGAVAPTGGVPGMLAAEAPPGGSVSYTFTPSAPGTFAYHSGTHADLQIEMGLVGAIVVRPSGYVPAAAGQAYDHADSSYDHEYLFLLSEIDPVIHEAVESGNIQSADTARFFPVYWLINGRAAPDTMTDANARWLPSQPYNCMPQAHPGEKVLMRMVGAGRDLHPFHTHGNHHRVIARNGRLLTMPAGSGADAGEESFTSTVFPGQTLDALYAWTGEGLGWDAYGHSADVDNLPLGDFPGDGDVDWNDNGTLDLTCAAATELEPQESAADHCKPFPVVLPSQQQLAFGMWYSGSPFLGSSVPLPPGEGGLNPNAGYFFMFHSHNEKEIVNYDVFPGGMLTMMDIVPPGVELMNP